MDNALVVDLQYGDEDRGIVSAFFAKDHDWTVRFNGGSNSDHIVWHKEQKHSFYHLPDGRPRRCTWLILDDVGYAMSILQPDTVVVTKLDILEGHNICV